MTPDARQRDHAPTPRRLLLATLGTHGDVEPFLHLARALSHRAHTTKLLLPKRALHHARARSLDADPLDGAWDAEDLRARPETSRSASAAVHIARRLLIPRLPDLIRALDRAIDDFRPDALLCHHLLVPAPRLCARRNLPFFTVALAPMSWPSIDDVAIYPGMPDVDHFHKPLITGPVLLGLAAMHLLIERPIDRALRARSLPPLPACRARVLTREMLHAAAANLGLWSPRFRPPAPDDPPNSHVCGAPIRNTRTQPESLPAEARDFLRRDPPALIATLGPAVARHAPDLHDNLERAARIADLRLLLLTGDPRDEPPRAASTHTLRARWLPHEPLFEPAAAVVHHAGVGTAMKTLAAALPAATIPFANDQFDNASRLRRLGVARPIRRRHRSPRALAAIMRALVLDQSMRARAAELAAAIRQENAGLAAARVVEDTLDARLTPAPPTRIPPRAPASDHATIADPKDGA